MKTNNCFNSLTSFTTALLLLFCFVARPALSQEVSAKDPVTVSLVSSQDVVTAGSSFDVAVVLDIEKDWHSYWKNPGDAGLPTDVQWDLPEGFSITDLRWPYPKKFSDEFGVGFGYEDQVVFFATVRAPTSLQPDTPFLLRGDVRWMACKDSCIPGFSSIETEIQAGVIPKDNLAWTEQITQFINKIPTQDKQIGVEAKGDGVILSFQSSSVDQAFFFPTITGVMDLTKQQSLQQVAVGNYELFVPGISNDEPLQGVVVIESEGKTEAFQVQDTEFPITGSVMEGASIAKSGLAESELTFGVALVMAFVGGMILNCMPCVLPVISFKVMSFIQLANENRKKIFTHSFMFFVGVMASFWALATLLLLLQGYGQAVGWGFQLQEPIFVGMLALGLVVFAMSLFGVFELGTSLSSAAGSKQSQADSLAGSFLNGVLATAVATPCTGPFLGASLGFAATLPPVSAMLIFTMMGLGMALPYLLLGIFPQLLRFLPKPGPWMETFKQLMGFLILATVLWLSWIFAALTSTEGVMLLMAAFVLAGLASWVYGRWGSPVRARLTRRLGTMVALVILAVGVVEVFTASLSIDERVQGKEIAGSSWQRFSSDRLQELRASGTPVFIDFTAKWCLICQTNKAVLHSNSVEKAFEDRGVVTMVADWTKSDPEITEMLRKFGRNGVPLYVLYGRGSDSEPLILPQVLTPELVEQSIKEIPAFSKRMESEVVRGAELIKSNTL